MRNPESLLAGGHVCREIKSDVYRVALRNGHEAVAHLSKELRKNQIKFLPEQRVLLSFSTHDLSRACIIQSIADPVPSQADAS